MAGGFAVAVGDSQPLPEPAHAVPAALLVDDDALVKQCRVDAYRGSGPGGQKRNKTSNAIRLTHAPTGAVASAADDRSTRVNRLHAARRLRVRIAAEVRTPIALDPHVPYVPPVWLAPYVRDGRLRINPSNALRPAAAAVALDLLLASHGDPTLAALNLGVSLRSYLALLHAESAWAEAANALRTRFSLGPLQSH